MEFTRNDSAAVAVNPANELVIDVQRHLRVNYFGTMQQLLDAGVLPESHEEFPRGTSTHRWHDDRFSYSLRRRRMPGTGTRGSWVNADYWEFSVQTAGFGMFDTLRVKEAEDKLREEQFRASPRGIAFSEAYWQGKKHKPFQDMLSKIIAGAQA
jgi:hypothetical protein